MLMMAVCARYASKKTEACNSANDGHVKTEACNSANDGHGFLEAFALGVLRASVVA